MSIQLLIQDVYTGVYILLKESKGLRAREENQRVEKMERQREKKRKISVGNS
jgi:hypothetical protein